MPISEATAAVLGTAASAGAGIAGAGAQLWTNKQNREFAEEQSRLEREWNEKMYNEQNAWNYEMWQKQNEYNTPAAQVQRLRDAGLNPMFYGLDGTGNAGDLTAAQPLGYTPAQVNQLNPLASGIDSALKVAQVSNIQANTAKQNNENLSETIRREKMLAEIDNTKQQLLNLKAQEGLTEAQIADINKRIEWADRLNSAVIAEKEANAALSESQKKRIEELLEGEKLIQSKTLEDFDKKWKKIEAEIKKMAKETGLLQKDIENYALNHTNNGFMGTGLSLQNLIRALKGGKPRQFDADSPLTDIETDYNID